MVIPLSLSSVMYTQYIPVFIFFFRFDDDAKLKKRDSEDVSYSKKSVSYLETALNQINTEGGGESRISSFPSL